MTSERSSYESGERDDSRVEPIDDAVARYVDELTAGRPVDPMQVLVQLVPVSVASRRTRISPVPVDGSLLDRHQIEAADGAVAGPASGCDQPVVVTLSHSNSTGRSRRGVLGDMLGSLLSNRNCGQGQGWQQQDSHAAGCVPRSR